MKTSGNETSKLAAQTRDKSSSSGENFVFEVTVTSPRQRLSPEKVIDQVFLQVDEKSEQFSMRFNAFFSRGVRLGGALVWGGGSLMKFLLVGVIDLCPVHLLPVTALRGNPGVNEAVRVGRGDQRVIGHALTSYTDAAPPSRSRRSDQASLAHLSSISRSVTPG